MLSTLPEAVTARDPAGRIVFANHAALSMFGFDSLEDVRSRRAETVLADYILCDEHGGAVTYEDLPALKLLSGAARAEPMLVQMTSRSSGELKWLRFTSTSLQGENGARLGVMTAIEDVTAVKTAEVRMRALAESGRILASSLDYAQTLRNVAQVAVLLADYCSVDLIDERQQLRRVAAAHRDPNKHQLARELGSLAPATLPMQHPLRRVLETNESALFELMGEAEIAAVARDAEHLRLLRRLELRSMLIVPMRVPARTLGVVTLATDSSRRRLGDDDVEIAEQLGRRAAVAVENSRLHTKLTGIAETLQTSLLPAAAPVIPGWEIASLYRPAATEFRVDVGGDFYEFFEHESSWFAIVGDVTGKGVGAASVTALMRHGARVASRTQPAPAAILTRLDEALAEQPTRAMATAICMSIRAGALVISSAGHPPAIIVSPDGRLREVPAAPDPMLGAFDGVERQDHNVDVQVGELVVSYTDGVPDAPGLDERFGMERLRQALAQTCGAGPQATVDCLKEALDEFTVGSGDDVAVLALQRVA
jgi:PAS domain S-box-containing protein